MLRSLTKKRRPDGMTVTSMHFAPKTQPSGYADAEKPGRSPNTTGSAALHRIFDGGRNYQAFSNKPAQFRGGYYSELANTALQNVFKANAAKERMQEQRILGQLFGTKMQTDASRANTRLRAATQLNIAKINDATANRRIGVTQKYYADTVATKRRGQDLRYAQKSMAKPTPSPEELMRRRRMAVPNLDIFRGMLPREEAKYADDAEVKRAYARYLQTGEIPKFKKVKGWWLSDPTFMVEDGVQKNQDRGAYREISLLPDEAVVPSDTMATKNIAGDFYSQSVQKRMEPPRYFDDDAMNRKVQEHFDFFKRKGQAVQDVKIKDDGEPAYKVDGAWVSF